MIEAAQRLASEGAFNGARRLLDEARRRAPGDPRALRSVEETARWLPAAPTVGGPAVQPRSDFRQPAPLDDRQFLTIAPRGKASADYSVGRGRTLLCVVVMPDPRAEQVRGQLSVSVSAAGKPERMLTIPPFSLELMELPRDWPLGKRRVTIHNRGSIPATVRLLLLPDA
jgi:hypothetical protein